MFINIQGLFKLHLIKLRILAVASVVSNEYGFNGKELLGTDVKTYDLYF